MWPKYVDMTDNECKLMLRKLELEAYSNVVSALRAQGPLTDEKQGLLLDIASELHIPRERYSAEIRRAVNDERLSTIALQIYGPNTEIKWAIEGRREVPIIPRLHAQTAYSFLADKIANITVAENAKLPFPTKDTRKEVQISKKSDVTRKRSVKKTEPESKASPEVSDEKNCKEKDVKTTPEKNLADGRIGTRSVIDKKDSVLQKVSLSDLFGDSIPVAKKDESPVKKRKVVARSNVNKPLGTVVPKNVKNGKAILTAKAISTATTKPTQIISAVKSTAATPGAKVVAVASSSSSNMLKIVNKNMNSPFSSNSSLPLPSNSVVTGIKVMTPRSSATAAVPRSAHGSEFPRFMRPNLSSVRPNVTSNVSGVRHNVVVMQKNSQVKRNVTISSKDLGDKMLKRKPPVNVPPYLGPTASKVPKLSQDGSQNVATSQGNILVAGIGKGNSSLPPQFNKLSREIAASNVSNNVKTYTKPKFPLPPDIPKSIGATICTALGKVTPVSVQSPMKVSFPKTSSSAPIIAESKPRATVPKKIMPAKPVMPVMPVKPVNRVLSTSCSSFSDLLPSMPSTKIIITDHEGKFIGTVPSSIASTQNQINLIFSNSADDPTLVSKTVTLTTSTNPIKSVVVPSSKPNPSFVSLAEVPTSTFPEKPCAQSNVYVSRERLVSLSNVCDKPIVSPKIQNESNLVVDQGPIIVNVPSTSGVECSDSSFVPTNTSNLSDASEILVNLSEADAEEVGVLDPVTGVYSFPFDEQDSTVSVNSLASSVDLADQLDCNLGSQLLSVSPVPESESVMDSSLSHIITESAVSELDSADLNESTASTETVHECDISNISVTEVTLEETLECFESVTEEMYSEEIVEKDAQNIDGVLDHL